MTKFVPHTEPDFDTTADGLSVAFRDRGGQHHALVTAQENPLTGVTVGVIYPLTQTEYDAIVTKDPATLYLITGA